MEVVPIGLRHCLGGHQSSTKTGGVTGQEALNIYIEHVREDPCDTVIA